MSTETPQYFASHSSGDRPIVRRLVKTLTTIGVTPWYCNSDIRTGDDWQREIKAALERSDGFILIMTPSSAKSQWVRGEVTWALDHLVGRVFPLLYRDCDPTMFDIRLPRIQSLDCRGMKGRDIDQLLPLLHNVEVTARSREAALAGSWRGEMRQGHGPEHVFPLEFDIQRQNRAFVGTARVDHPKYGSMYFRVTGGFYYDRFLQLNYYSMDPARIQFGALTLELADDGHSMKGEYLGYGAFSQRLVRGSLEMNRVESSDTLARN